MKALLLPAIALVVCRSAFADVVVIKGSGKTTSVTGDGLVSLGLAKDQAVAWEVRYSNEAVLTALAFLGFVSTGDYREEANLGLTVRIGDQVWIGFIGSGENPSLRVMETTDYKSNLGPGAVERTRFVVERANGAVFERASGAESLTDSGLGMTLEFTDAAPPYTMLDNGAFQATEAGQASGAVTLGSRGGIAFNVTLGSLTVETLPSPAFLSPAPRVLARGGSTFLAWRADAHYRYEVRSSEDLRQWRVIASLPAPATAPMELALGPISGRRFYQLKAR